MKVSNSKGIANQTGPAFMQGPERPVSEQFQGRIGAIYSWTSRAPGRVLLNRTYSRPYSTRRVRQIIHQYAESAGIGFYPHLFRHQIITFLTRKGIISAKLQLLSGRAEEKSLAIYRDLALADVSDEYEQAMRSFPVR